MWKKAPVAAFLLTLALLYMAESKTEADMLLAERIHHGLWIIEALLLSVYAAWLVSRMLVPQGSARWRPRVWKLFSLVFFGQALLGILGMDWLLMTGRLHVPVPAVIVGGPIYRGEGLFMPILLISTILVVGPAWCSHLCYFGAWDDLAARRRRTPGKLPSRFSWLRLLSLLLVVGLAMGLRFLGSSAWTASLLGIGFGALGTLVMAVFSTRTGQMIHCLAWCPIGLLVNLAGRISPFRIRIDQSCTACGACTRSCRYGALGKSQIDHKKPAFTCSLCGDCLSACPHSSLQYRFLWLSPRAARTLFLVLVISMHAVFLGLARI